MRDYSHVLESIRISTGLGVRVAILDSGANPVLPGINESKYLGFECQYTGGVFSVEQVGPEKSFDRNGHGSLVHSCLYETAPDVEIDHYRVLDTQNQCDIALLCYALDYVLEKNYNIVNLSLGARSEEYIPWLVSIMKRAYESNTIIVTASSNLGNVLYPARFTYCISVDACHGQNRQMLYYRDKSVIEVSAWGIDVPVRSTFENVTKVTGTSYAAAHVSGIVARAIEAYGPMSMVEMKLLLAAYAEQLREGPLSKLGS